ncbi:MAG TPA: PASTA domain-containing protein [Gaiellaceae bacterium]|nr:PASTA domain-containing protein [Gaiellaceae bacterium]
MRGENAAIADETEITQSFRPVAEEEPPPPAGPPPPPPGWNPFDVVGPWIGVLAALAVIGFLVWFFGFRHGGGSGHVVPRVVGLQEAQAISRLNRAGYDVKSIRLPLRRPRGVVGAQAPGAGSRLPTSGTVTIRVSTGRAPARQATTTTTATATTAATTTAAAPAATVPDVTGQDVVSGAGQVEAAGFVAQTDPVQAQGTPGTIVQESPPGGTGANAGETVTLGVAVGSSRPATQIPDVTGQTAAAARASLLQAKLTVRTTYRHGKAGVVLAQSPTGSAPAYTQVTIAVGR